MFTSSPLFTVLDSGTIFLHLQHVDAKSSAQQQAFSSFFVARVSEMLLRYKDAC